MQKGKLLQAKGRYYSVQQLLACDEGLAQQFNQGAFATLYLSPRDYHRVHMPISGQLTAMNYIPGALFSVQPSTVRVVPQLFARNERLAMFFTTAIGTMAVVMVGATIVGSISTSWHGDVTRESKQKHFAYTEQQILQQGDELGYFKLGSTVILLFAAGEKMKWDEGLTAGTAIRFGNSLGSIDNSTALVEKG